MNCRAASPYRSPALLLVSLLFGSLSPGPAASAQGTRADYERARSLAERTRNTVANASLIVHWLGDSGRLWYRREIPAGGHEFILTDANTGQLSPAFDHNRLAAALTKAAGREISPTNLPLDDLAFAADVASIRFEAVGKRWNFVLARGDLTEQPAAPPAEDEEELPRASTGTGEETWITFVNRTDSEVELFWLDEAGDRHSYGRLESGAERRQHTFAGHAWLVLDAAGRPLTGRIARAGGGTLVVEATARPRREGRRPSRDGPGPESRSPDGRWSASVVGFNVRLREAGAADAPLTWDGNERDFYAPEFFWSPNSRWLVVMRTRKGDERQVNIIESAPRDQLQPRLHTFTYDKPGDRLTVSRPRLFEVATRRAVSFSDALLPNPWSLSAVRWAPDSSRFTVLYNQRGHQVVRVLAVEAETGTVRVLVDESSPTFVDYAHKLFAHWLDDTRELIWMSERDGWNHLYLYDAAVGTAKNPITHGVWVVRGVDHVDAARRQVWFRALDVRPGQDPYQTHFCRVNFDGSGLTVLTEGDGTHAAQFSTDRRYFVDTWSRVDQPPVHELRSARDGRLIRELERADISRLLATGWRAPQRFVAKGRDGTTDIYGLIYRPTNFDPAKRYPVIESIYAGPQDFHVPKAFRAHHRPQELAELGFIVVQIDGMGTNWRSKPFHDVCWKNLGDAGFPDRIAWLRAAAAQYPEMDLTRVGIYGGSAGGQNAMRALIAHGDFYQAAAADCGCHDNRMDKVWWNELWMGWPVGPHYEEASNVAQAYRLRGKLLLTVGEMDRNVDPASTMQVVDALVRADKDFELLIVPGAGHGAGESPYAARRREDFFVRQLLGVEPRR